MAKEYTQAQWARLQSRLPEEDRVPYAQSPERFTPVPDTDPLAALQASVAASKAQVQAKNIEIPTIALEQAVNTGDKNAIIDAAKAVAKAQGGSATTQASNAIEAVQAATPKPTLNPANIARGDTIKWVGGVNGSWQIIKGTNVVTDITTTKPVVGGGKKETRREVLGAGASRVIRVYYDDGSFQDFPSPDTTDSSNAANTTGLDANTLALIKSLQDQIATLSGNTQQAAIDKAAAEAAARQEKAENAIAVLTDRFTRYGLASLVPRIKQLAISGASESTITLQLQESEEYKTRFKANQDRIKKGLRVLDPGDYLNLEDDYRQILRAYGLKAFDTDAYVQQFIANDIATTELSNRVVTAVQRVQNADPAILTTLRSFYGISDNDLVAYVLDPNQQFQKIERQVAAAEIGAAAGLQGISTGVSVAEQLAAQGVTKAQAQKGYATIADILPTADKLSGIYEKALPSYGLAEAEQEVFNTLASAQRKRRALAEREIAEFSGASGLSKSALSKQIGGTY
jgi:hypothetical protein